MSIGTSLSSTPSLQTNAPETVGSAAATQQPTTTTANEGFFGKIANWFKNFSLQKVGSDIKANVVAIFTSIGNACTSLREKVAKRLPGQDQKVTGAGENLSATLGLAKSGTPLSQEEQQVVQQVVHHAIQHGIQQAG